MVYTKEQTIAGREAVDAYRLAHAALFKNGWYKGLSDAHTPLLDRLLADLKKQGFNSLAEFFGQNEALSAREADRCYTREGICNRCGKCCGGCSYYNSEDMCTIHDGESYPEDCKLYPTIEDFRQGLPKECSYTFRERAQPEIDVRWK